MCGIPEIRKCCFCFPLRFGLLAWAYAKLMMNLLLLFRTINYLIVEYQHGINYDRLGFSVVLIITILTIVDFVFLGIFVVSAHKKEATKMKLVYLENMGFLIFCILIFATFSIFTFSGLAVWYTYIALVYWFVFFSTIFIQVYFVILMRSEVLKLERNSCQLGNLTIEGDTVKCGVNV